MGEEVEETEAPKAELDEEEKKLLYVKATTPDLTPHVFSKSFTRFSVPEKSEGFDEIKFNWSKDAKCKEVVKSYILTKKTVTRIEDLNPSAWFKQKLAQWAGSYNVWCNKQKDYAAAVMRKADEKRKKERVKAAKAKAAEQKAKEEAEKKAKAAAEGKEEEKKEEKEEEKPMEVK